MLVEKTNPLHSKFTALCLHQGRSSRHNMPSILVVWKVNVSHVLLYNCTRKDFKNNLKDLRVPMYLRGNYLYTCS